MELEPFHLQNSYSHTLYKATQDLFAPCKLIHILFLNNRPKKISCYFIFISRIDFF